MHIKGCKQNTKGVLFKLIANPGQKLNPKVINPNNHETNRYWEYRWGAKKPTKKLRGAKQRSQLSIRQKQLRTHDELGIGNSRGMRHR